MKSDTHDTRRFIVDAEFARTLERELNAERDAREQAQAETKEWQLSCGAWIVLLQEAEALLADAMTQITNLLKVLPHDHEGAARMNTALAAREFLSSTVPPPILAELERLRRLEKHQQQFPVLDAKWLDPECHHGCKSLVFKHERDALKLKLEAAKTRDGDWLDKCGSCKVCDGEIPHGHTNACHIYKQEQEITRLKSENEALRAEIQSALEGDPRNHQ